METTTEKRTAEQFAANYKTITKDGFYGPITVGNIVRWTNKNNEERILINLCVKTAMSGDKGAVVNQPASWYDDKPFPYAKGDQVNVTVKNGYADKISHCKAETL